ncbi:hypothetical protein E3P99_02769 [Wallemia hederae]|uniref:Zn(2)-C6 fungal-type domain-containing protein n=1 Tax=Wallemia hederae TaxID=1540922 RepID=A0A4T0FIN8_9BASI|nr:hypothetical protein E3P99_02769 [Wallemia hederae]
MDKKRAIQDTAAATNQQQQQPAKKPRRKNVSSACLYCRRSHMTCDDGRPCQRCVKRNIAHLCHDPPNKNDKSDKNQPQNNAADSNTQTSPDPSLLPPKFDLEPPQFDPMSLGFDMEFGGGLYDFVNLLGLSGTPGNAANQGPGVTDLMSSNLGASTSANNALQHQPLVSRVQTPNYIVKPQDRYFFTAANPPVHGTREERLKAVLTAKHDAGLLRPFNYVKGYAKLGKHINEKVSPRNRLKIQSELSRIRAQFAHIASNLTEWDLTTAEESFERLLLDYDRVFSVIALPSCCWRRTGEIYKANREFADIVGCDIDELKSGSISIHELLDEESLTNYWNKYGQLAFNAESKGVLTSGSLVSRRDATTITACNFSFNIRRDRFGIPLMIVANFMRLA